jgi:hypothetical protein
VLVDIRVYGINEVLLLLFMFLLLEFTHFYVFIVPSYICLYKELNKEYFLKLIYLPVTGF